MAQGDFTKAEADRIDKILSEMFEGIPKRRRIEYLGHLNDIALFLQAAKRAAPEAALSFTPDRKAGTTERTLAALESIAASLDILADATVSVGVGKAIAVTTHPNDDVSVCGTITNYPETS